MSEFHFQPVFTLDEGICGTTLKVAITFDTATKQPLDVSFSDPTRDQLVSVPWDLWARVVAAVDRNKEF